MDHRITAVVFLDKAVLLKWRYQWYQERLPVNVSGSFCYVLLLNWFLSSLVLGRWSRLVRRVKWNCLEMNCFNSSDLLRLIPTGQEKLHVISTKQLSILRVRAVESHSLLNHSTALPNWWRAADKHLGSRSWVLSIAHSFQYLILALCYVAV